MPVVWFLCELEFTAVSQELFKLVRHSPAKIFGSRRHLYPFEAFMFNVVLRYAVSRPRQAAKGEEVDEH